QPQPGWKPSPGSYPPPPPSGWGAAAPTVPGAAAGLYRDQASGLMLPNGTQLAGVGRRIGAFFLAIPLAIVTLGIGYLVWGLIVWGRGQTPALQVLGMRCYRPETGRVANWGWMALREVIGRLVDGILSLITQVVSFVLFAARGDHRSLHDLIAGTVVLHDPNKVLAG
ncbi:MAG: RDD family protein, partial [Acidimicrobiales bacterium]